jgi:hypothetical protein
MSVLPWKFIVLFSVMLSLICLNCASEICYFNDKSYFRKTEEVNRLFVCPVQSVDFEDSTRDYADAVLKMNYLAIEDSLLHHFNRALKGILKKNSHSSAVILVDSGKMDGFSFEDTNRCDRQKLYDKKFGVLKVKYLKKMMLDSLGIACDYALYISDVKIFQTEYYVPILIPLPGAVIGGSATGPAFGIRGKYILWDYKNNTSICAGNFNRNFRTIKIGTEADETRLHSIVVEILNKTPYWKIQE